MDTALPSVSAERMCLRALRWKNDFFAYCRNMRIKSEIIDQNDTKSGYLFRNSNSGGCYVN